MVVDGELALGGVLYYCTNTRSTRRDATCRERRTFADLQLRQIAMLSLFMFIAVDLRWS
jgi:hypothetical protein